MGSSSGCNAAKAPEPAHFDPMSPPGLESQSFFGSSLSARTSYTGGRRMILVQAVLVGLCAAPGWALAGQPAATASLLGGAAAVSGSLAFAMVARACRRPAPSPGQALRAVLMAGAAKWVVSLGTLAALLSGATGVEAVTSRPGWAVLTFCVAWVAPLLTLLSDKEVHPTVWPPKT